MGFDVLTGGLSKGGGGGIVGLKRVFQNKLFEVTRCFKLQNHKNTLFISIQARGGLILGRGCGK